MLENQPINPLNNYNYNQPFPSYKKWYQKKWGLAIIVFIIIVVLLLSLLVISTPGFLKSSASESGLIIDKITAANLLAQTPQRQLAEKLDRPHLGQVNAKLVIVEFSDFECPACIAASVYIKDVTSKYAQDLKFVYRHFPLEQHPLAMGAATAAEAAGLQGKFWEMHDLLFQKQGDLNDEVIKQLAKDLQLDMIKFDADKNSQNIKQKIQNDTNDALSLKINSTPTFFLNGQRLKLVNLTDLEAEIKKIIDK